MGKGTMCCPAALRGAESAPGQERGLPAACAASTDMVQLAGCLLPAQPRMQGRHSGVVRVSEAGFGVAAVGFAATEVFFRVIWLNSSRSWLVAIR